MKPLSALVGFVVLILGAAVAAQDGKAVSPSLLKATFGKLPLYFVENRGVYSDEVAYYIQGADKTLFFTRDGLTFRLKGRDGDWVVKLEFVGSNPEVVPRGDEQQQAVFSYFKGPEKDWKTGLRTYSRIVYRDLWPGIDLVYRAGVGALKYEFLVAPGADPAQIRLRYRGVTSLITTDSGALRVETPEGSFEDAPPAAWQDIDGERVPVAMAYDLLRGRSQFGFRLGSYDPTEALVLDPVVLVYCGYLGGTSDDQGYGITIDAQGNAYITGTSDSPPTTFPVRVGPVLTKPVGRDAFVAKLDRSGTSLFYCGYIGGSGDEWGFGIAVDGPGNAYVTGRTQSADLPVKLGPHLSYNGGSFDGFVAKVNALGTGLDYCGYIGGIGPDEAISLVVDAAGCAYVTGFTDSSQTTFPVKVGPDLSHNGSTDAFVAKVSATGATLDYCGYIGGVGADKGWGIAVNGSGSAYLTGETTSDETGFPVRVGPDLTFNGASDSFVAKVNAQGTGLDYCGYIGGTGAEVGWYGNAIALDGAGCAYVVAQTSSLESSFPVRVGPDVTFNGISDGFVAKVNAQGTGLDYCGYIGGASSDWAVSVAVDRAGNAHICGWTDSSESTFPVTVGPDLAHNGSTDVFVAKVSPTGRGLVYCGYIGGAGQEWSYNVGLDGSGDAHVVGITASTQLTFPVNIGPGLSHSGLHDCFVTRVSVRGLILGSGASRPGGTVTLALTSTGDSGRPYQLGSSLGTGPIPIDTRWLDLSSDDLLLVTVNNYWPTVFSGYRGVLDGQGQAKAAILIPNIPALIGVRLHTAFVTLDPQAPSGIRSISNTFSFSITQ